MEKKSRFSPPMVGGSSLLVIFAVLTLTIFSLLTISTVQADSRLADAAAQAVSGYYEADTQAESILAQLRHGTVPDGVTESDGIYSYTCPISDTQALAVSVSVDGADYTILRWQAVSSADWVVNDDLPVWDGGDTLDIP